MAQEISNRAFHFKNVSSSSAQATDDLKVLL